MTCRTHHAHLSTGQRFLVPVLTLSLLITLSPLRSGQGCSPNSIMASCCSTLYLSKSETPLGGVSKTGRAGAEGLPMAWLPGPKFGLGGHCGGVTAFSFHLAGVWFPRICLIDLNLWARLEEARHFLNHIKAIPVVMVI